jgi:hypothetical protein
MEALPEASVKNCPMRAADAIRPGESVRGRLAARVPESCQVINLSLFSSSYSYVHLHIKRARGNRREMNTGTVFRVGNVEPEYRAIVTIGYVLAGERLRFFEQT